MKTVIKKYGDYISSVVLLVFSISYFGLSFSIDIKSDYGGGALVPRICAVLIFACALTILYNAWRMNKKEADKPAQPKAASPDDVPEIPSNYRLVSLTLAAFTIYAAMFAFLGFILSTALYLVAQIMLLAPEKNKKAVIVAVITSVITTAVVYLLFQNLFFIMLPTGSLWLSM